MSQLWNDDDEKFERSKAEHLRNVAKLWDEVVGGRVSEEEAKQRLATLKWEQERLSGLKADWKKSPNPRQVRTPLAPKPVIHEMDLFCSCKRCSRLHTITMQDAKLLKEMGIKWESNRKRKGNNAEEE